MLDIQNLLSGTIPWVWQKLWANGKGPETPQLFFNELHRKYHALIQWENVFSKSDWANMLETKPFCLEDCFYPETFINAFRQYSAQQGKKFINLKIFF